MRRVLASCLIVLLGSGNFAFGQQTAATPPAGGAAGKVEAEAADATVARAPVPNTLLDGTAIKLRLGENISSETSKTGDSVPFEATEEVMVDGVVVIPKGAQALATVTNAEPKRRMGRGGKLDVNVDSVRLAEQGRAVARSEGHQRRRPRRRDDRGDGGDGGGVLPAAPLFLFMHGKSVDIPKGTEVIAFVQGDMKLEMAKFAPVPAADATATTAAASGLTIDASVPNCDIEVDGSFVGNTPSTLNLAPGKHDIVVKKAGYKDWTRSMTVSSGVVRVSADMVAAQ